MDYTILESTQQGDILLTTVELRLIGATITVQIAHFNPRSQEEIDENIRMRMVVEQYKLDNPTIINENGDILL